MSATKGAAYIQFDKGYLNAMPNNVVPAKWLGMASSVND